ncbi:MAG TPA: hypothetical protein VL738_12580 [Dactylosporangium sp.]|nr:hypothetical protein [Dactylosporangium sp.]
MIAFLGWAGAALVLAAYALVSSKKLAGDGATFQLLNIVGAVGLAWNSAASHAWPSVAINVAWVGIGAVAMFRLARRQAQREYQGARMR